MLFYTAVVSSSNFAQNAQWGFMLMSRVIIVLTLISMRRLQQISKG